jgi:hypothetical protein
MRNRVLNLAAGGTAMSLIYFGVETIGAVEGISPTLEVGLKFAVIFAFGGILLLVDPISRGGVKPQDPPKSRK